MLFISDKRLRVQQIQTLYDNYKQQNNKQKLTTLKKSVLGMGAVWNNKQYKCRTSALYQLKGHYTTNKQTLNITRITNYL